MSSMLNSSMQFYWLCRGHKLYGTVAFFSSELRYLELADHSQSGPFWVLHSMSVWRTKSITVAIIVGKKKNRTKKILSSSTSASWVRVQMINTQLNSTIKCPVKQTEEPCSTTVNEEDSNRCFPQHAMFCYSSFRWFGACIIGLLGETWNIMELPFV